MGMETPSGRDRMPGLLPGILYGMLLMVPSGLSAETWHSGLGELLLEKCAGCHSPGNIAPFSLDRPEEYAVRRNQIAWSVESGRMPPWLAKDGCRDYHNDYSLAAGEKQRILDWLAAGAPAGTPVGGTPEPKAPENRAALFSHAYRTPAFLPRSGEDEYRCFIIDTGLQETRYLNGRGFTPGNKALVHHMQAFRFAAADRPRLEELDGRDRRTGWHCLSSPYPGGGVDYKFVSGWGPGQPDVFETAGRGMAFEPGDFLVVQIHYNTLAAAPTADPGTLWLNFTDRVEQLAGAVTYTNMDWVYGIGMDIPAGDPSVTHSFTIRLGDAPWWQMFTADIGGAPDGSFLITGLASHMHELGVRGRYRLIRADGREECLLDQRWDFNWQGLFVLTEPVRVEKDDRLVMECTWDNSAANQPFADGKRLAPAHVEWGGGTRDEMCLGFVTVAESRP